MSIDFGSGSHGDAAIGGVAGRDHTTIGIPPAQVLPHLLAEIREQRGDLEADRRNREVRQNYLDNRLDEILAEIRETRDDVGAEQALSRAVLSRMTLALTVQSVSLGALLILCVGVVIALLRRSNA